MKKVVIQKIQEAHNLIDKYLDDVNEGVGLELVKDAMAKKKILEKALEVAKKAGNQVAITRLMNAIRSLNRPGEMPYHYVQRMARKAKAV